MALAGALDDLEKIEFNRLTTRNSREALKEVTKTSADGGIKSEIAKLDDTQKDTLMKVLYVGLAGDPASSAVLLKWHAQLFEAAGPGSIIRTLTSQAAPQ